MVKEQAPSTPPVINPAPKARFMELGTRISNHRNLMQSPVLRESIDYALLQYQHYLAHIGTKDATEAATSMLKQRGALEFIDLLYKLAETVEVPRQALNVTKLDHNA